MTRKCHNHTMQTNPQHHVEETQNTNNRMTSINVKQPTLSSYETYVLKLQSMAYGITGLTGQSAHSLAEQEVKKETVLAMVHTMMELIALGNLMRNVIATHIHVQVRYKIHL